MQGIRGQSIADSVIYLQEYFINHASRIGDPYSTICIYTLNQVNWVWVVENLIRN